MGKLVHFQADGSPVEIKLDRQRITIGRRPDNDICLPYPAVSGEHAVIVTILDDSFLEDLGSTNGTLVNGAAVAKHFLRDRDEIDVGRHVLIYCADDAASVEPPRGRATADVASAAVRGKSRSASPSPHVPAAAPVASAIFAAEASFGVEATQEFAPAPDSDFQRVEASAPPAPTRAIPRFDGEAALMVMTGAKAGRVVPLVKEETLIGRPGVQVVALRRTSDEVRLLPIEGATPPRVNGVRVVPEGRVLALGDILEIAGSKLEVIVPTKRTTAQGD